MALVDVTLAIMAVMVQSDVNLMLFCLVMNLLF